MATGSVLERLAQRPGLVGVRDVSLFVDVRGHGHPLLVMHGGPSADHWTMLPFRELADEMTVVSYDHRCNGRSTGRLPSMTWDNLTADADALRSELGFERWAVLGHSFGGHVALEYALRYPDRLSHLVLLDTAAHSRWARDNASKVVAARGYGAEKAELVRRWFRGELEPREYFPIFMRIAPAYQYNPSVWPLLHDLVRGEWHVKVRPETYLYAARHLLPDWSVLDRLGEVRTPTLVMAGRQDFIFPPECQAELSSGILGARLHLVDKAGHNPHSEQTAEVMRAIREFIAGSTSGGEPAIREPAALSESGSNRRPRSSNRD
jgi:pimeloyl-ACP methyl ester carboxylesterase